jgi:hypothetical protein
MITTIRNTRLSKSKLVLIKRTTKAGIAIPRMKVSVAKQMARKFLIVSISLSISQQNL